MSTHMAMGRNISTEQLVAVLEALVPESAGKMREAFGVGKPTAAHLRKGFTYISAREAKWYPQELIKLSEAVSPMWARDDFRAKSWMRAAEESVKKLKEANPETALAFLLRKGVQTLANDWYLTVPREWQDYAGTNASDAFAEWYAPLYGSTVAGRVAKGGRFPEGKIIGEDSVLVNYKFGLIESFDRELFDDDQTGQIRQRATRLGQGMAITENAYAAIRFIGAAGTYSNLVVPASNYTTINVAGAAVTTPFSISLFGNNTAGNPYGNRPSAYVALGLNPLKQGWSDLLNAKDPLNNKIIVSPNTLLHSSQDALHAPLLVSPPSGVPYYPAIVGPTGTTQGGAGTGAPAGYPGGVFGANPFMGLGIKPVLARFLPDWAWSLGEKGKGFIFQERDPLEVIQEQPATGAAFETDAYRFRSRRRFEADWVGGGSRFWWLGNDGSVAGTF